MTRILVEQVGGRKDRDVVLEILRYDWLRCGFRYLPECLKLPEDCEQPEAVRSRLYQSMPMEIEGLFYKNNRNHFFENHFLYRSLKGRSANSSWKVTRPIPAFAFCRCGRRVCTAFMKQLFCSAVWARRQVRFINSGIGCGCDGRCNTLQADKRWTRCALA